MSLHHSIAVEVMLEDLLLYHILTEFKQIDTVDEILLGEVVAFTLTDALDCLRS